MFMLMWSMKNKGDKPHYKPGVKDVLKKKYQKEEKVDEKPYPPTRLFKNVPNSVVKKANKEADKVKREQEKAVLGEPPVRGPSGDSMHSKDNVYEDEKVDMVSLVQQAIDELSKKTLGSYATKAGRDIATTAATKNSHPDDTVRQYRHMEKRKKGIAKAGAKLGVSKEDWQADQKQKERDALIKAVAKSPKQQELAKKQKKEDMSLAPKGKGRKAAKALYKEEDIDMPSLVQQAINELTPDQKKKREASRTHSTLGKGRRLHGGRSAAHPKGAMVSGKTHTYDKPAGTAKKPGRQKIVATPVKKEGTEGDALVKAVANSPKQQALKKKQMLSITPAGKKALEKGDHKLSITPKGRAAVEEVTHFGDVLRQAIVEAKKVNAIDTINKIVKTKTMGKLHGQKVDLFTASAIQQVYNALNKKNQAKMVSVMSKDVHGLLKMADFSMKQMKR